MGSAGSIPPPVTAAPAAPAAGAATPVLVGEGAAVVLPEKLQDLARPVAVPGTVAGTTPEGLTRIRTSLGDVMIDLAAQLSSDRAVTVQVPAGQPPGRVQVFANGPTGAAPAAGGPAAQPAGQQPSSAAATPAVVVSVPTPPTAVPGVAVPLLPGVLLPALVLAATKPVPPAPGGTPPSGAAAAPAPAAPSSAPATAGASTPSPPSAAAAPPAAGATLTPSAPPGDAPVQLGGDAAHRGAVSPQPASPQPAGAPPDAPAPEKPTPDKPASQQPNPQGPAAERGAQPQGRPPAPTPQPEPPRPGAPPSTGPAPAPQTPQPAQAGSPQPAATPLPGATPPTPAPTGSGAQPAPPPPLPAQPASAQPPTPPASAAAPGATPPAPQTPAADPLGADTPPPPAGAPTQGALPPAAPPGRAPVLVQGATVALKVVSVTPPGAPPAPPPDAAAGAPPAGPLLHGTVAGATPQGQAILATPQGMLVLTSQGPLPPGTRVVAELADPLRARPLDPPRGAEPLPPGRDWPALRHVLDALATLDPELARALGNSVLPQPNKKLGAALTFLLSALRHGDARGWLGEEAATKLERAGQADLLRRMEEEFATPTRSAAEAPGDWKPYVVPMMDNQTLQAMEVYVRPPDADEQRGGAGGQDGKGNRFVFEVTLSRFGPLQLDGLVRPQRFDLILRSHQPLPADLQGELTEVFADSLGAMGFAGALVFQTGARNWVKLTRAGRSALGVTA